MKRSCNFQFVRFFNEGHQYVVFYYMRRVKLMAKKVDLISDERQR